MVKFNNYCMGIKVTTFKRLLKTVNDSFLGALLENNNIFVDDFQLRMVTFTLILLVPK